MYFILIVIVYHSILLAGAPGSVRGQLPGLQGHRAAGEIQDHPHPLHTRRRQKTTLRKSHLT